MAARFFKANGALNASLPSNVPRYANEAAFLDDFLAQWYNPGTGNAALPWYNWGTPWINGAGTLDQAKRFSVPVVVVPHSTTRIPVEFHPTWSTPGTYPDNPAIVGAQDGYWPDELAYRLAQGVPVPSSILNDPFYQEATWGGPGAPAQVDGGLAIVDDTTNELWEFWVFVVRTSGTLVCAHAGWIPDHTQSDGVWMDVASPYQSSLWGSSATSISIAGAQISQQELIDGVIPHAMGVDLMGAAYPDFFWPAQRTDGQNWSIIPEGARFRLAPSFDVNSVSVPGNTTATRTARMIAQAWKDYGIIFWDKGGSIAFQIEPGSFDWSGGAFPDTILKSIPISSSNLQVVDPTWRPGQFIPSGSGELRSRGRNAGRGMIRARRG